MLNKALQTAIYFTILYAIYLLVLLSLPYLSFEPGVDFLITKQFIYHIDSWRWSFYLHVFSSSFIILCGLFQFNRWMIHRQKKLHKLLGYSYISLLLLISGPAAFIMSLYANGGIYAQISFTILSILWIGSTALSLYFVLKKQFERHGNWLLRSYALTLSAVTLRFYAYLLDVFNVNLSPVESYILISYLGWIPNLILAEIMIRTGFIKRLLKNL